MTFFALPDSDTLYAALLARDPSYEGRAFVGVSSTGIFCRLTCPARNPKRENCTFYDTIGDCIAAGFRPCKRCHPLRPATESDPVIKTLLDALEDQPDHKWCEGDIAKMGLDLSTVRRAFKRHFGMTFLELARLERLRKGFEIYNDGGKVIDAQLEAGFSSASAFRASAHRLLGAALGNLSKTPLLCIHWIDTPLWPMIAVADNAALHLLEFMDRKALPTEMKKLAAGTNGAIGFGRTKVHDHLAKELDAYFNGISANFTVPLYYHGGGFSARVWDALREIPAGQTVSYSTLAKLIGQPTASRAAAKANGSNQIAILIPCHRVLGADGSLTGYGGGLWRKQRLIEIESVYAKSRPVGQP